MKLFDNKKILILLLALVLAGCKTITSLNLVGAFDSGLGEGAAEIIAYDASAGKAFVVNAEDKTVDVLQLGDDGSFPATPFVTIDVTAASDIFQLGGANSLAVKNGILAVAIENDDKQANGVVAFYSTKDVDLLRDDRGLLNTVEVGALPDMVKFTPNGKAVVVANEGEPSDDYKIDPEGSVSVIHIDRRNMVASPRVYNIGFGDFNIGEPRHAELPADVRIFGPNASVAQDLEPEYVAVSSDSKTAWVSFQENNAIAKIDLKRKQVTGIYALGFKDHSLPGNEFDASNRDDVINIRNWPTLGMYQPDAIDAYEVKGKTYIVTANEGDARDYWADADDYADEQACLDDGGLEYDEGDGCLFFSEELRVKDLDLDTTVFIDPTLQNNEQLGRLKTTSTLGDANADGFNEEIYSYGARSFSIWDENATLVYDSGADIANVTADYYGPLTQEDLDNETGFNAGDDRSDDKGAEPESVVVGHVDGKTYAFVGLERTGGIMVYDISNPQAPNFILYLDEGSEHVSPEGLEFVPASASPTGKPLLMVAHEVSGTSTVYEIETEFDHLL